MGGVAPPVEDAHARPGAPDTEPAAEQPDQPIKIPELTIEDLQRANEGPQRANEGNDEKPTSPELDRSKSGSL